MNSTKSWPWVTAWNKLYRTELFLDLRYPDGVQHEDQFLAHYVFSRAKYVVSISDTFYYLQYRENSITNSKYTIHQLDYMDALYDRIQLYQKNGFKKLYGGGEWKGIRLSCITNCCKILLEPSVDPSSIQIISISDKVCIRILCMHFSRYISAL
mgnify:CR=1 FL=1